MDARKELVISACLVLLYCALRETYPESIVTAGMVVALLFVARAMHAYWTLVRVIAKEDGANRMDSDITGLYMLVRFYKRHGWPALTATMGNVTLGALVFLWSLMWVRA